MCKSFTIFELFVAIECRYVNTCELVSKYTFCDRCGLRERATERWISCNLVLLNHSFALLHFGTELYHNWVMLIEIVDPVDCFVL